MQYMHIYSFFDTKSKDLGRKTLVIVARSQRCVRLKTLALGGRQKI